MELPTLFISKFIFQKVIGAEPNGRIGLEFENLSANSITICRKRLAERPLYSAANPSCRKTRRAVLMVPCEVVYWV